MGKKILVIGANFKDKGSQSKLFVVTDELKKRLGDCQIFFASDGDQYNESDYRFKKVIYTRQYQNTVLGNRTNIINNIAHFIRKKEDSSAIGNDVQKFFTQLDLIIDIKTDMVKEIIINLIIIQIMIIIKISQIIIIITHQMIIVLIVA